jgi:predicted NUDIX family phosphoesterase
MEIKECVLGLKKSELIEYFESHYIKPIHIPNGKLYSTDALEGFITEARHLDLTQLDLYSLARPACEENYEYVQLIPYIVLFHDEEDLESTRYLTYKRGKAGNEARLHDMYSIGFGGHVDTGLMHQEPVKLLDSADALLISLLLANQIRKELEEEIGLRTEILDEYPLDIIYDAARTSVFYLDDGKVNSVHLCLPVIIDIGPLVKDNKISELKLEEGVINDFGSNTKEDLESLNLESWSSIMLNFLRDQPYGN